MSYWEPECVVHSQLFLGEISGGQLIDAQLRCTCFYLQLRLSYKTFGGKSLSQNTLSSCSAYHILGWLRTYQKLGKSCTLLIPII